MEIPTTRDFVLLEGLKLGNARALLAAATLHVGAHMRDLLLVVVTEANEALPCATQQLHVAVGGVEDEDLLAQQRVLERLERLCSGFEKTGGRQ